MTAQPHAMGMLVSWGSFDPHVLSLLVIVENPGCVYGYA